MDTRNLRHIYNQLSTNNDAVMLGFFDALIDEIESLQGRVEVLERVRVYNEGEGL